ncbi:carboxylesterase/lipase family protein [Salana multivorans]
MKRAPRRGLAGPLATLAVALLALSGCTGGGESADGVVSPSQRATPEAYDVADDPGPEPSPAASRAPTVTIEQGALSGVAGPASNAYLGIPYAAPPVGDLRWHAPEPAAGWAGTRDASTPGPHCPQAPNTDSEGSLEEDCLYLNVHTPAEPASESLPVLVFLHGGGHAYGTPNIYSGHDMAATGGAVVVIPAFRVGLLGFFGTAGTAAESEVGAQGNWGMLDQQQALRWVADNIAAFGGDPDNVTIVGESAGGSSVCFQLASPMAAGLFHRAIIQSSGCGGMATESAAPRFAAEWGCEESDLACLREVPIGTIVDSAMGNGFAGPTVGGPDQPVDPLTAAASGTVAEVPVIIGVTRDEWVGPESWRYPLDPDTYREAVTEEYGDGAAQILERYPADAGPDPMFSLGWLRGDAMFACPAIVSADALADAGRDVYVYEFADRTAPGSGGSFTPPDLDLGATHTSELPYLFGYTSIERPLDATQRQLADTMIATWVSFAAHGVPTVPDDVAWPQFHQAREVLVLQGEAAGGLQTITDFEATHHCDLWR